MKKYLFILLFVPMLVFGQNYQFRANVVPDSSFKRDLGADTLRWRKLYAGELSGTIFAKQTISLVGGYLRLGKNCGVLKYNASSNIMDFGQTMTLNDLVEFRGVDGTGSYVYEYVRVGSQATGTAYFVTRNLDGSGEDYWKKGMPYSIIGQAGNGYIDLQSYNQPKISMFRQNSTTWNDRNELLRIGDLNGIYGYSAETYGMGVGSYANNSSYITIDTVNGIRFLHKDGAGSVTTKLQLEMDGDATFTGAVTFTNQGSITISGFNNDAGYITEDGAAQSYYQASAPTGINEGDFWFDTDDYAMFRYNGATWDRTSVYMDGNGLYAGNINAGQVTAGTFTGLTFQTASSGQRVAISSATNDITFYSATLGLQGNIRGAEYPVETPAYGALIITGKDILTLNANSSIALSSDAGANVVISTNVAVDADLNLDIGHKYKIDGSDLNYTHVGAAASTHYHAGADITSGTVSTDRYSAYADLGAESKIGTGSTQVAAGNHTHTGVYAIYPSGYYLDIKTAAAAGNKKFISGILHFYNPSTSTWQVYSD